MRRRRSPTPTSRQRLSALRNPPRRNTTPGPTQSPSSTIPRRSGGIPSSGVLLSAGETRSFGATPSSGVIPWCGAIPSFGAIAKAVWETANSTAISGGRFCSVQNGQSLYCSGDGFRSPAPAARCRIVVLDEPQTIRHVLGARRACLDPQGANYWNRRHHVPEFRFLASRHGGPAILTGGCRQFGCRARSISLVWCQAPAPRSSGLQRRSPGGQQQPGLQVRARRPGGKRKRLSRGLRDPCGQHLFPAQFCSRLHGHWPCRGPSPQTCFRPLLPFRVPVFYGWHRIRRPGERRLYSVGDLEGSVSSSSDDGSYLRVLPESHTSCASSHDVALCIRRGISRRSPPVNVCTKVAPRKLARLVSLRT